MMPKNEKIKVCFLSAKPADNDLENDVLISQLMITAAKIGIRDLKGKNCAIIESEANNDKTE